jgi:hypothetical protein
MPSRSRTPLAAALLLCLAVAGPARAAGSLDDAVGALVQDVKNALKGKDPAVKIASIVPDPKSHVAVNSAAGTAVLQKLREQLVRAGVQVKLISDVTLSGTFREVEDGKGRQLVELEIKLFDRTTGKESELAHRFVGNEVSVAHLLGVSVEYPSGATPKERAAKLKREVDKFVPPERRNPPEKKGAPGPAPALDGNRVRAAPGSRFAIQVEVAPPNPAKDGKRVPDDYRPRKPVDGGGLALVDIQRNELYAVRLINDGDFDVAVSLTIDGLSVFVACDAAGTDPKTGNKVALRDPKTGKPLFNHVIVCKRDSALVRGWFVNLRQSDEFKVTEYAKSLAKELKSPAPTGMITACFHAAVPKDAKFPPGEPADKTHAFDASATGRGARFDETKEVVERKIGGLRAQVSLRYSK